MSLMVVRSRLLIFLLWFEWLALPLGLGGAIGSGVNLLLLGLKQSTLLLLIANLLVLFIGVSSPIHRKLGLRRGAWEQD